jgi:predicted Fe-Mo cluster-binding NifX family protein
VLVDLDGREVRSVNTVENPYHGRHQPGRVPGFIKSQGAELMLAGGMGWRAITLFKQSGIEAVTGASGTVRHALQQYLDGTLHGAEPCRESVDHGPGELTAENEYEKDELSQLREEVEILRRQLDEAKKRLGRNDWAG